MAKNTHSKMEFAELIDTIKAQNQGQIEAQKETTHSLRSLHAYFLKQDRADTRRRLEEEMEKERPEAERVGMGAKFKGAVSDVKGALRGKGLAGIFSNFLATGLLGAAGAGLFKTAISALKFTPGFGLTLGRLFGAALLLPSVWDAVSKGVEEYNKTGDLSDAIAKSGVEYFGKASVGTAMGLGAFTGLVLLGPRGAIAGAILGGAFSALQSAFGAEDTKDIASHILDFLASPEAGIAMTAGFAASLVAKSSSARLAALGRKGVYGAIAYMLIAPAISAIEKSVADNKSKDKPLAAKITEYLFGTGQKGYSAIDAATNGAMAGFMVFGIKGAVAGFIIGGVYGALDEAMYNTRGTSFAKYIQEEFENMMDIWILNFKAIMNPSGPEARKLNTKKIDETMREARVGLIEHLVGSIGGRYSDSDEFNKFRQGKGLDKQYKGDDYQDERRRDDRNMAQMHLLYEALKGSKYEHLITRGSGGGLTLHDDKMRKLTETQMTELVNLVRKGVGQRLGTKVDQASTTPNPLWRPAVKDPLLPGQVLQNQLDALGLIKPMVGKTNARGAQVYRKPTIAVVAEKPGTAEYIMSDNNLARLAETIANQRENQTLSAIMPMMMGGGGGGGASMPVVNNSYSYQNVDNIVTELPATSILNMTNALA